MRSRKAQGQSWVVFHAPAAESAQASVARAVAAEGLTRQEAVEVVSDAPPAGVVTFSVFRTKPGPRLTIEFRKGLDDELIRAALIDALGQLDATRPAGDQAAA
jgi:hypothetical protein